MKIGIFSGSFNPIHIGHLILANYISEFTDIDRLWFMVTPQSPFKVDADLLPENQRLEMVDLAIKNYPKIESSNFEFDLPQPSYTVNTLQKLSESYPQHSFVLVIGADNWQVFDKWKDSEHILNNYQIYIYPRLGYGINVPKHYSENVSVLNSPIVEISSTFIRESLLQDKNTRAFLPEAVYDYIIEKGLYK